jgi:hypothetical protein
MAGLKGERWEEASTVGKVEIVAKMVFCKICSNGEKSFQRWGQFN